MAIVTVTNKKNVNFPFLSIIMERKAEKKLTITTTGKIGLDIGATSGQFPPERNIGINITLIRGKDM